MEIIGLMPAVKAELVHTGVKFLVCHVLTQYLYVNQFYYLGK